MREPEDDAIMVPVYQTVVLIRWPPKVGKKSPAITETGMEINTERGTVKDTVTDTMTDTVTGITPTAMRNPLTIKAITTPRRTLGPDTV